MIKLGYRFEFEKADAIPIYYEDFPSLYESMKEKGFVIKEDKKLLPLLTTRSLIKGTRTIKANQGECYILGIDLDDGTTMGEVIEKYKRYRFIAYDSYNSFHEKVDAPAIERLRVFMELNRPYEYIEIKEREGYLIDTFAPDCDVTTFSDGRLFAIPGCRDEKDQKGYRLIYNDGIPLTLENMPLITKDESERGAPKNKNTVKKSDVVASNANTIDPDRWVDNGIKTTFDDTGRLTTWTMTEDTLIQLADKRVIRAGDVKGHHQCYCPVHLENDKSPGAFTDISHGNVYLVCGRCSTGWIEKKKGDALTKLVTERRKTKNNRIYSPPTKVDRDALIELDEETYCEPYSRDKRKELMRKNCMGVRQGQVMLMDAGEGFGKSYLAEMLIKDVEIKKTTIFDKIRSELSPEKKNKVIFASDSNYQAEKQFEGFIARGVKAQLITGRGYNLQQLFGIEAVDSEANNPFEQGSLDRSATIREIMQHGVGTTKQRAEEIWNQCAPEPMDFINNDIIFTTVDKLRSYGLIIASGRNKENGFEFPENTYIFYDDTPMRHFKLITTVTDYWRNRGARYRNEPLRIVEKNNREYYVRPDPLTIGFGFESYRLIFTTTELIMVEAVKRTFDNVIIPDLMPPMRMKAGNITTISTTMCYKKLDGLLLPIMERIRKIGYQFNFIADGMGQRHNLMNNKGKNDLADKDNIIELSTPHIEAIIPLRDELGFEIEDTRFLQNVYALDQFNQSVGRNGGYRWGDLPESERKGSYVLIDPHIYKFIVKHTRYYIDNNISDIHLHYESKEDFSTLLKTILWFLHHYRQYVFRGLKNSRGGHKTFRSDVSSAISSIGQEINQTKARNRIMFSVKEMTKKIKNIRTSDILGF